MNASTHAGAAPDAANPGRAATGEEFRDDLRAMSGALAVPARAAVGSGNAAARRLLTTEELAPLTRLHDVRSVLAMAQTFGLITLAVIGGLWGLRVLIGGGGEVGPWSGGLSLLAAVVTIGVCQHGLIILAHEAAHYRLLAHRGLNDVMGRLIGMASGISMCTYRVIHRLHHNHLFGPQDPDTAIHGGYPRGVAYLWKKLAQDMVGWNAWKWLLPLLTVLQPILRLRAICEHGAVDDVSSPLRAARSNRTGGAWRNRVGRVLLFPHHVNYHLEHHLYPAVPHYHLRQLHHLLREKGVFDHGAEVRDLSETFGRVFAARRRPAPT